MAEADKTKHRPLAAHAAVILFTLACGACTTAPRWEQALTMDDLLLAPPAMEPGVLEPAGLPRQAPGAAPPAYRIRPHDELTLTVWGPRDIWGDITAQGGQATQVTPVHDDGTIVLPLLRHVQVAGLTMPEALARIAEAYRAGVRANFQVDGKVTVFRSQPVLLDGAFARPGVAWLSPELGTLGEAVAAAGGLSESADPTRGLLVRGGMRYAIDYGAAQHGTNDVHDIRLQPGDRLFFPSRAKGMFYVFGEVVSQGGFPLPPTGMSLMQALATSKGPQMITADMQSIYLVRAAQDPPVVYRMTLAQIMGNRDLAVAPGDRIFVPPTGLTNWDRTMQQLLPGFGNTVITYKVATD
ncbi:MAG TPA: polysaccharide biosynthesis/export family protein [Usitatibacter sp.]|nr:polysaccharide biosynthesis/export family protein [Usitatibacter sp.]